MRNNSIKNYLSWFCSLYAVCYCLFRVSYAFLSVKSDMAFIPTTEAFSTVFNYTGYLCFLVYSIILIMAFRIFKCHRRIHSINFLEKHDPSYEKLLTCAQKHSSLQNLMSYSSQDLNIWAHQNSIKEPKSHLNENPEEAYGWFVYEDEEEYPPT